MIPYGRQFIDSDDIKAVIEVLKSDWLTQGAKIDAFEKALSEYCGAKYAVAVSSGTAALHLACIAAVDKSVGEVLDYLQKTGLDKNTVVIYTSDQGFYLGEHGWFDKRWMFEESYRTPLLIRWPGVTKPGSVNSDMVSNIDLPETFLDIAGIKVPSDMQGRSMLPILKGKTPSDWRKEHYYHYYEYPGSHMVKRHYGISTERYKLIHYYYDIDEWELYDIKTDPLEMKNVYNDPAYASIKKYLHKRLKELMDIYGDSEELAKSFLPEKKSMK